MGDRMSGGRYRLGVDVGGTHTDLVLLDTSTGALMVEKVSSTPKNPALGVLNGVGKFIARGIAPADIAFFAHGTTITTNALLEMRGAKVGLLITKGYRAVQEVQNQARDGNLFDYFFAKPAPIAPQRLTKEIPERCDYAGRVLRPLDKDAVRRAARELKDAGVESIAVCFLFSFMNPMHEQETRALIREEFAGVHVSLSSEVLPRIREWARLSTTLLNAYLEPVIVHYVDHLNRGLDAAGLRTQQRFLMQSNGGVMPFSAAIAGGRTVQTLFSGPAAGAQASAHLAREEARRGLVTLDMGGTSADIAFIEGGAALEVTEGVIARRQVDVPALDMVTISAGGGSIAWIDGGGFLNVGPQSAGADPGPACYGRGGLRPTVTDADLVCGYLNPDYFLGGAQRLDPAAARAALETHVGAPLKMDVTAAAAGIQRIVDMRMADEVRVFAAKRGVDLSAFTLLPFGGAGAVHAAAVAEELGMRRILVPPRPGAFSALGLRYPGQGYELRTPLEGLFLDRLTAASLQAARERFDERHAHIHGHAAKERPVELVSYRLRVRVAVPKYEPRETPPSPESAGAVKGRRTISLNGTSLQATLYERDRLGVGATVAGPTIVEQFDATTLIPRGWNGRVDGQGNLILARA